MKISNFKSSATTTEYFKQKPREYVGTVPHDSKVNLGERKLYLCPIITSSTTNFNRKQLLQHISDIKEITLINSSQHLCCSKMSCTTEFRRNSLTPDPTNVSWWERSLDVSLIVKLEKAGLFKTTESRNCCYNEIDTWTVYLYSLHPPGTALLRFFL